MAIAFVFPALLLGCMPESEEVSDGEELVGTAEQASARENAMAPNSLHPNSLHPNSLHPNSLHPNALTPDAVTSGAMTALQDPGDGGTLSRMLLKYVVNCALGEGQSFTFTWSDAQGPHPVTYYGSVGLAPLWVERGLTLNEQKWVTACVGARTNYYGVTVMVSMRGPNDGTYADETERGAYTLQEGAFWGNIFSTTPYIRSCHIPGNEAAVRAKQRACAMGHAQGEFTLSCGILSRMGSCSSLCTDRTTPAGVADDGFASCDGETAVVSTYLMP